MIRFELKEISRSSLERVLAASFPESGYYFQNNALCFEYLSDSQKILLEQVLRVLVAAENFKGTSVRFADEYTSPKKEMVYERDIHIELERRGDLFWIGEGLALLSGDFLSVKKGVELYWKRKIYESYEAREIENPALWSPHLARASNYLDDFPQEAMFVLGSKPDSGSIERIKSFFDAPENHHLENQISAAESPFRLLGLCQPSVCTSCYYAMGKKGLNSEGIFTTHNRVFRNEGTSRLDRLLSFSVRDVISVGEEQFVKDSRDTFFHLAGQLIEDFELEAQIVRATDPFFAANANKLFLQKTGDLKHEIQAWIPYLKSPIAIGSINLHLDSFGRRFNMQLNGHSAHSACMGIGFERFVYALFSQNGPEFKYWNRNLLAILGLA